MKKEHKNFWVIENITDEIDGLNCLIDAHRQGFDIDRIDAAAKNATENGWHCDDWKQIAGLYGNTIFASEKSIAEAKTKGLFA